MRPGRSNGGCQTLTGGLDSRQLCSAPLITPDLRWVFQTQELFETTKIVQWKCNGMGLNTCLSRQPPHKRETLSQALSGNDDGLVWPDRLNCSVQEVTSPNRSQINMRCSKTKRRDRRTIHIATWFFGFCSWMHLQQTAIYGASESCTANVFSSATKPRERVHVTYSVEPISHSLVDGLFLHQRLCTSNTARDLTHNSQFCLLPTETTVSSFHSPMRRRQTGAFL